MTIEAKNEAEKRGLLERIAWLADAAERQAERAGEDLPESLKSAVRAEIARAWQSLDP